MMSFANKIVLNVATRMETALEAYLMAYVLVHYPIPGKETLRSSRFAAVGNATPMANRCALPTRMEEETTVFVKSSRTSHANSSDAVNYQLLI